MGITITSYRFPRDDILYVKALLKDEHLSIFLYLYFDTYLPAFVCFPIIGKVFTYPTVDVAKGHFHFGVFHRQANQSCIRIWWLGVSIVLVVNFLSHASVKFSQFVGIRFLMHLKSSKLNTIIWFL